jgi:hypothetical protein
MRRSLAILAGSLAFAGCGNDDGGVATEETARPTEPATTAEPATTGEAATAECTSDEGDYRIEYPAGWHEERCAFFDPDPFEVPEATEFLESAVLVSREPVSLETLAGDDRTREILTLEETQIAGREAVRLEAETTGEGLLDRGVRFYLVGVEADGESVILTTYDLGDADFERNVEVLDEMAESLQLER